MLGARHLDCPVEPASYLHRRSGGARRVRLAHVQDEAAARLRAGEAPLDRDGRLGQGAGEGRRVRIDPRRPRARRRGHRRRVPRAPSPERRKSHLRRLDSRRTTSSPGRAAASGSRRAAARADVDGARLRLERCERVVLNAASPVRVADRGQARRGEERASQRSSGPSATVYAEEAGGSDDSSSSARRPRSRSSTPSRSCR